MKNKVMVELLLTVAVRLGTGQESEMPLMVAVLRKVADVLERRQVQEG